jgi:hypothetical protein
LGGTAGRRLPRSGRHALLTAGRSGRSASHVSIEVPVGGNGVRERPSERGEVVVAIARRRKRDDTPARRANAWVVDHELVFVELDVGGEAPGAEAGQPAA